MNRKSKKRVIRFGIVFANIALLGGVGAFVVQAQSVTPSGVQPSQSQLASASERTKPLDTLSSADVAVHVARLTGLQESTAVVNKADTVNAQLAVASTDEQVTAKPQILSGGLKSKKDIKNYVVEAGDTIPSIATKFGITPDTIRNSNGLSGDAVQPGKTLVISPINGLIYTVKAGDTPDSIASKHYANKDLLIAFNDAELTGNFRTGEVIVIPDGVQESAPVARTASRASTSGYAAGFAFGSSAIYSANGYDYGWCTWHAANRRAQIGRPIPSNLGNAVSWLSLAQRAGIPTGNTPQSGAVVYQRGTGALGHVAFVEKVNDDGTALVSDMNYPYWGRVTYRTINPADYGKTYSFIY